MRDTDYIEIRYGRYGMVVAWGPYGQPHFLCQTSLEPELWTCQMLVGLENAIER